MFVTLTIDVLPPGSILGIVVCPLLHGNTIPHHVGKIKSHQDFQAMEGTAWGGGRSLKQGVLMPNLLWGMILSLLPNVAYCRDYEPH